MKLKNYKHYFKNGTVRVKSISMNCLCTVAGIATSVIFNNIQEKKIRLYIQNDTL